MSFFFAIDKYFKYNVILFVLLKKYCLQCIMSVKLFNEMEKIAKFPGCS